MVHRTTWTKFFHRAWAMIRRKFWTNCPRCSHPFGGHEAFAQHVVFPAGKHLAHFRYVCQGCAKLALPAIK